MARTGLTIAVAVAAVCGAAGQPAISAGAGNSIQLSGNSFKFQTPAGSQAMAITSRSGTFNANTVSSTPSIVSLGKMAVNDQLTLQFSLSGCNNAQYSLTGSLLSNTSQVSGDVSTSFGMTVDGPYQPFSQYVGFNAMYGLDSGSTIGLSVAISTTSLDATCTGYSYTYTVSSLSGAFDTTFTASGGAAMMVSRRVTQNDLQLTTDSVASLQNQLTMANQAITMLQGQLTTANNTLNALGPRLDNAIASINVLRNLTADYTVISNAVNSLTNCSAQNMQLGADGVTCVHTVPQCPQPTNLPSGVSLAWTGEAVPGTVANVVCQPGFYSMSPGAVCQRDMTWTSVNPQCTACPANCTACSQGRLGSGPVCTTCRSGSVLYNNHCLNGNGLSSSSPMDGCHVANEVGMGSGVVWVRSNAGRVYQTYCFNTDNTNGWTSAYGGGWEVVWTQMGGYNLPNAARSNRNLRNSPNVNGALVFPDIRNASGRPTQRPQMSAAMHERGTQGGMQWMKFMAKIQNNVLRGQDAAMLTFPSNFGMLSLFQGNEARTYCKLMPGQVSLHVNGLPMGQTTYLKIQGNSVGFANQRLDRCGQPANNVMNTVGRSTWTRIADTNTDNAVRHMITYVDAATGRDSSRCNYCCWGCTGWREMIVWAVRPTPSS